MSDDLPILMSWETFIKKYPGLKKADGVPPPYFIAQEAHATGWAEGFAEASGPKDERRVVTAQNQSTGGPGIGPIVFHADNGEIDQWQPGDQFEVLHIYGDKVLVERSHFTGWITKADLEERTTEVPP